MVLHGAVAGVALLAGRDHGRASEQASIPRPLMAIPEAAIAPHGSNLGLQPTNPPCSKKRRWPPLDVEGPTRASYRCPNTR